MTYNPSNIADLLIKSLIDHLNEEEQQQLDHWLAADPRHPQLMKSLIDGERLKKYPEEYAAIDSRGSWEAIRARLPEAGLREYEDEVTWGARILRLFRNRAAVVWLTVGVLLLLIAAMAAFTWIGRKPVKSVAVNAAVAQAPVLSVMLYYNQLEPIDLSAVPKGWRFLDHNLLFSKPEEGLVQISALDPTAPISRVSVTTPKGAYYRLQLPDSSIVDLNAESRLEIDPLYLKERRVTLLGEAYFEVRHQASHPFDVEIGPALTITALGTAFDVKAYPEDSSIRATLVTGMLRFRDTAGRQQRLGPHQTVVFNRNGQVTTPPQPDTTNEMPSWVNGQFDYKGAPIQEILHDLSHWYNVDIELKGEAKGYFTFSCSRQEGISFILSGLAETGRLKYTLIGNKARINFDQP